MAQIVELRVDNFRRIRAVEIRPDGSLVVVSGKNGEGKTSVLHAIWAAFKGRAVAGPTPIGTGAEACTIRCQTDEFTVTRSFKTTKDGELTTDLKLVMADGRKIDRKPQAMLDALLPDLALDPLEFMRRPVRDQVDTLKGMVRGFDFAANAAERDKVFAQRTDTNRMRDNAQAAADKVLLPAGPEPTRMDAAGLAKKMAAATEWNKGLETRRERRLEAQAEIHRKEDEAEQLRVRAATLEAEANALRTKLDAAEALPSAVDTDAIAAEFASVAANNTTCDLFDVRRRHLAESEQHAATSTACTDAINALDEAKRQAIAAAKLPVDGLEFDDDGIRLGGVPFEQASLAEKLRASIGIGIALCPPAPDPALRIMTIDEGSELDSHSMALVAELADAHGYQIWLARVDETGKQGFVIEDGSNAAGGK